MNKADKIPEGGNWGRQRLSIMGRSAFPFAFSCREKPDAQFFLRYPLRKDRGRGRRTRQYPDRIAISLSEKGENPKISSFPEREAAAMVCLPLFLQNIGSELFKSSLFFR